MSIWDTETQNAEHSIWIMGRILQALLPAATLTGKFTPGVSSDMIERKSGGPLDAGSLNAAISLVVSAVSLKEVALTLPDGAPKDGLNRSADLTIAQFIDDYCGTPPHQIPIPWPGPPPAVYGVVTQLAAVANTFHASSMRNGILQIAGRVVQKAFGGDNGIIFVGGKQPDGQ